jgi:hypothetical protein
VSMLLDCAAAYVTNVSRLASTLAIMQESNLQL